MKGIFYGRFLDIEFAKDAGISNIITGISRTVKIKVHMQLSAKVKANESCQTALRSGGRNLFLLVGNLWWVNGIPSNNLTVLGTMLHDESLLVYTTRDDRFLNQAQKTVASLMKDAHGDLPRHMSLIHARFDSSAGCITSNQQALKQILHRCGGFPLVLGIAGSIMRAHQRK